MFHHEPNINFKIFYLVYDNTFPVVCIREKVKVKVKIIPDFQNISVLLVATP